MAIKNWRKSQLKLLCTRIGDGLHGTLTYDDTSDVLFINGNNLKNGSILISGETKKVASIDYEKNHIELNDNTLLLSINGTLGEMAFYNGEKVMLGKSAAYLNFKTEINRFYYYYFQLREVQRYFHNVATGSTIKNLGLKSIQDFEVPYPDDNDWKPIERILSDIDKKIDLNNKINADLEAMAKLIYDYWFVQYDFPDSNGKPYKSSGGDMVFSAELSCDIPDGWAVEKLGKVIKTSLGGTPSTKIDEYWDEADIPWLNSGEVANFPIVTSEMKVTQAGIDNSAAEFMPKGSVIISIVRHLRVSILAIDAAFNQSVVGLYETETLKNGFLYPYLSRELPRLMSLRTGAQQPHINKGVVDDSNILIPKESVLVEYYKVIEPIFKKINLVAVEQEKLHELRDWLLPMLMNGQVTVK